MTLKSKTPTILSLTAVLVAVFGSTPIGHAAGNLILAKNSVGTAQLQRDAITGPKVKNGSLTAADFKAGTLLAGPKGDTGAKGDPGAPGPKGDPGDRGPAGPAGISGYKVLLGNASTLNPGQAGSSVAACPTGLNAIGGGFTFGPGGVPTFSETDANHQVWMVQGRNDGAAQSWVQAMVICGAVAQ